MQANVTNDATTNANEWALADVFAVASAAAHDRVALVWRDQRRTFGQTRSRIDALACFLTAKGFGALPGSAERWQCAHDRVAVLMHNRPEHVEALIGCWRARVVPFNVNYHYTPHEVADLVRGMGARAAIYERGLGEKLRDIASSLDLCVVVDDGSTAPDLPGAVAFEAAIESGNEPSTLPPVSPDDRYMACTGGTTGRPKGVLWRQADLFVAALGGPEGATADQLHDRAAAGGGIWFPTSPLMHVAAQWTALIGLYQGATVILHDDARPFDMTTILETAARERANWMTIVGDAYARPLVDRLRQGDLDLSALHVIGTGGAMTSMDLKRAIHEYLPHVMIRDGYGATEIGTAASGALADEADGRQRFDLGPHTRVLSADRTRFLTADDRELGWLARCNRVPLAYLDDPDATEATFPVIDGVRVAVPGDRARMEPDGRFVLLGRDSLVVNTGGEKVFVEEVEEVLKQCDGVVDAIVVGRRDERFGQEVVAIVQLEAGAEPNAPRLRAQCSERIARYKAPRAFLFVGRVQRHPSGKPDYAWARARAEAATAATGHGQSK
jgi:acyl-CoA synthetase (AMP-forming)/AMP-acid ligase II